MNNNELITYINEKITTNKYTIYDVKEFLKKYNAIKRDNLILKSKILEYEYLLQAPKGMTINENGIVSGGLHTSKPEQIARLVDLKDEYNKRYLDNEIRCRRIKDLISVLENNNERIVLDMYYCSSSRTIIQSICDELNYSIQQIKRIKAEAIEHLTEYINENNILIDL